MFSEIRSILGNSWKYWRRILKCYEEYKVNGDILTNKKYRYEPSLLEGLPSWCHEPITAFLERKKREFRCPATIEKGQYPCIRFCQFAVGKNYRLFASSHRQLSRNLVVPIPMTLLKVVLPILLSYGNFLNIWRRQGA